MIRFIDIRLEVITMKSIRCKACSGTWIVEDRDLERQNLCPFCAASIRSKVDFKEYDTLGKVLYGAVSERGVEILDRHEQLTGWMMDMAAGLSTEIRIFSKNISPQYMSYVKDAFDGNDEATDIAVKKINVALMENEGLSESWAGLISEAVRDASIYIKGHGITRLVNVRVEDFDVEEALIYMMNAAKQGYMDAQETLGRWYVEDYNLPEMGIKWLNLASEQGSEQARDALRKAYNKVTSAYWLMNSPETEKMLRVYKGDSFVIVELESVEFTHLDKVAKHFSKLLKTDNVMVATKNFTVNGKKDDSVWACVAYFDGNSDKTELLKNGYEEDVRKAGKDIYTVFVRDNDFEMYKREIVKSLKTKDFLE
jgi:TPR repeat protein